MKTWLIFFAFVVFPDEIIANNRRNNLKKCFTKLNNLDIKPANVTYSQLVDLGTTYEQYYCRINEHAPHPYWQSEMTFLDRDCHNKDKCHLGKLEIKVLLTMIPVEVTTRYVVNATHIDGVFFLEEEITGASKRLMAVLKAKNGLFIYYVCSSDSWNCNDFHLNTDDKYPGDRSLANNIGMPNYFKWKWWSWDSWRSWGRRGVWDSNESKRDGDSNESSRDRDSNESSRDRDSNESSRDRDSNESSRERDLSESREDDRGSSEIRENELRRGLINGTLNNDTLNNDTQHNHTHGCNHDKHHKSCDLDHNDLKRKLRKYVNCDHCDYFRVQQMPWFGWTLRLTKDKFRKTVEDIENGMMIQWDLFTWPYNLFAWPSWTRNSRER